MRSSLVHKGCRCLRSQSKRGPNRKAVGRLAVLFDVLLVGAVIITVARYSSGLVALGTDPSSVKILQRGQVLSVLPSEGATAEPRRRVILVIHTECPDCDGSASLYRQASAIIRDDPMTDLYVLAVESKGRIESWLRQNDILAPSESCLWTSIRWFRLVSVCSRRS